MAREPLEVVVGPRHPWDSGQFYAGIAGIVIGVVILVVLIREALDPNITGRTGSVLTSCLVAFGIVRCSLYLRKVLSAKRPPAE